MKKLLIFTLANLLIITALVAQNNIWSLPPNYYVPGGQVQQLLAPNTQFPNSPGAGYNGYPAQFSHNAMQDAAGNLLFFIVDGYVYDKNGFNIGGGPSASPVFLGSGTETMIVPEPGDCNRYYIFTSDELAPVSYSILDFNPITPTITSHAFICFVDLPQQSCYDLNNPIVSDPINHPNQLNIGGNQWSLLTNDGPSGSKGYLTYAASKLNSNNKRFIYMQLNEAIITFEIGGPFLKAVDFYSLPFQMSGFGRGEMELVELANGNWRLAFSF